MINFLLLKVVNNLGLRTVKKVIMWQKQNLDVGTVENLKIEVYNSCAPYISSNNCVVKISQ